MEEWNDGKMEEREARNIITAMALLNFVSSIPVFQYFFISIYEFAFYNKVSFYWFLDYDLHLRTRI